MIKFQTIICCVVLIFIVCCTNSKKSSPASSPTMTKQSKTPHNQLTSLILKLFVDPISSKDLYQNIIKNTGLHKPGIDDYHVTLGIILDLTFDEKKLLISELEEKIGLILGNSDLYIEIDHADFYRVNRNGPIFPIVLYPNKKDTKFLKNINLQLESFLKTKGLFFDKDTNSRSYTPHITVADSRYLKEPKNHVKSVGDVIQKLNFHINNNFKIRLLAK